MKRTIFLGLTLLAVGCTLTPKLPDLGRAPEVHGVGGDGRPMSLAEQRGKVVLLCFWHAQCPPCRAMFDHERRLVERYRDKPFVLLGVNADANIADHRRVAAKANHTWASFHDGASGPIARAFRVDRFPTIILLDADGVVRLKKVGTPEPGELEDAIEKALNPPPPRAKG